MQTCDKLSCLCIPDTDAGTSCSRILPMCPGKTSLFFRMGLKKVVLHTATERQRKKQRGLQRYRDTTSLCVQKWSSIPGCWNVLGHLKPLSDTRQSWQWRRTSKACAASTFTRDTFPCRFPFLKSRLLALKLLQLRLEATSPSYNAACTPLAFLFQCSINESWPHSSFNEGWPQ